MADHMTTLPLSDAQEQAVKDWAADDRLWMTQDTVEFNLRIFARVILRDSQPVQLTQMQSQPQADGTGHETA